MDTVHSTRDRDLLLIRLNDQLNVACLASSAPEKMTSDEVFPV